MLIRIKNLLLTRHLDRVIIRSRYRQGNPITSAWILCLFNHLDKEYSDSPDFLSWSAKVRIELNDHERAWKNLDRAFEILDPVKIPSHISSYIYLRRGLVRCSISRFKEGLEDYNEALKYNPDNWDAYHSRGYFYLNNAEYSKARDDFNAALKLRGFSREVEASLICGLYMSQVKSGSLEPADAIQALEQWKPTGDCPAYIWQTIGYLHSYVEHHQAAILTLNEVIAIYPRRAELHRARSYCYHRSGLNQQALLDLQRVLRLRPKDAEAHNTIGFILIRQGKYAEAAKEIKLAIQLAPYHAHFYSTRGHFHLAQANFDQALLDFQYGLKLEALQPTHHWIKAGEAVTLFQLGQRQEARAIWQKLCQENDNYRTEQGFRHEVIWTEPALEVARKLMAEVNS